MLTINCWIDKNNVITNFLQLSHNDKEEIFFRVLWNDKKPSYFFDWLDNSEMDINNIDHISFHKSWTIHIRYLDSFKKTERIFHKKLKESIFKIPSNQYLPLLIFSVYDVDSFVKHIWLKEPLLFNKNQNISYNWDLEQNNKFSLVFFLLWSDIDYKSLLLKFWSIFNISLSPMLFNYLWNENNVKILNDTLVEYKWQSLLIAYTNNIIEFPKTWKIYWSKYEKEFNIIEPLMWINIVSTDEKIKSLK